VLVRVAGGGGSVRSVLDFLLLAAGLVLLTFAADRFVIGAARLSLILRLSPVLVGALVIGFGTSAPELVVTVLATLSGSQDLALGNLVGSNTANALLVVGAAALLKPLQVTTATLRREVPLMLGGVGLLAVILANGRVTAPEALLLCAGATAAVWVVIRASKGERLESTVPTSPRPNPASTVALTVAGLVGTLAGAQMLVTGAVGLARTLGISEAVIGLTVVAVGTSLPELVTAVAAARRGESDLVVGNVLGSNLFNSLPVAGIAGLLATIQLDPAFSVGVVMMVGACLLAGAFLWSGRRVGRVEGGLLLAAFAVTVVLTV
jgi:cation:H+ antiporter